MYTLYIYTIIYVIIYIYIYINNQVCIGFHKKTSRCLQFILETNWPWNGLGPWWWWWWWYRCVSKIRGLTNENRNTLMIQSEYHEIQQTNYSISKSDALIWVCLKNGGFTFKLWPIWKGIYHDFRRWIWGFSAKTFRWTHTQQILVLPGSICSASFLGDPKESRSVGSHPTEKVATPTFSKSLVTYVQGGAWWSLVEKKTYLTVCLSYS